MSEKGWLARQAVRSLPKWAGGEMKSFVIRTTQRDFSLGHIAIVIEVEPNGHITLRHQTEGRSPAEALGHAMLALAREESLEDGVQLDIANTK